MKFGALTAIALALTAPVAADPVPDPANWPAVEAQAKGQTVYWHAWGGSGITNDFIAWVGEEVRDRNGMTVTQVKLADTAEAVGRVVAEKAAGQQDGGAVDLIWINGANFASMKERGLLLGPWAEQLPNWQLVDTAGKTVQSDFSVPTEGYESPWSMAQVVFNYDSKRLPEPPRSMAALLGWARENPGRFTYPLPPDFLGTTFLKQALIDLVPDASVLARPADDASFAAVTAPLWDYLDTLTPLLWHQGRAYPQAGPRQIQLLADGEIDLAISFSPGEASAAIANGELPDTVRSFVLDKGTLGNASFVAIPYNASAKAGAMVVANFLLSPEAQARAQNPDHLGVGTVLALDRLSPQDRALFEGIDLGIATLSPDELGPVLPEPHVSWTPRLEAEWISRYGVAK